MQHFLSRAILCAVLAGFSVAGYAELPTQGQGENTQIRGHQPVLSTTPLNGLYQETLPNGAKLESHYLNGKRHGETKLYLTPTEVYSWHYQNGVPSGAFHLFDNITGTIDSEGYFTCPISAGATGTITGRFVCSSEQLVDILTQPTRAKQKTALAKCTVLEHVDATNEQYAFAFDGAFQFPKFLETSSFRLTDKMHTIETLVRSFLTGSSDTPDVVASFSEEISYYSPTQFDLIVQADDVHFQTTLKNAEQKTFYTSKLKINRISDLLLHLVQMEETMDPVEKERLSNELFLIWKDLRLEETTLFKSDGRKDVSFVGNVALTAGLPIGENILNVYNDTQQSIVRVMKTQEGARFIISYPASGQEMLSFDMEVDSARLQKTQGALSSAARFESYLAGLTAIQSKQLNGAPVPETVLLKNLKWYDIYNRLVLQSSQIGWRQDSSQQGDIFGHIRIYNPNNQYADIHFAEKTNQVSVEKSRGQKSVITDEELAPILAEYITPVARSNTYGAYLSQARTQANSKAVSLMRLYFRLLLKAYEENLSSVRQQVKSKSVSPAQASPATVR